MADLVLLNVSGEDRPGVTASFTELLGQFDIDILDIGQAVIHNHLNLGLLVNLPADNKAIHDRIFGLRHFARCQSEIFDRARGELR